MTSPRLVVSSTSLSAVCRMGGTATVSFDAINGGVGSLVYEIGDDAPWLFCVPGSGVSTGERDAITVNCYAGMLAPGMYTGTITLRAEGAEQSPRTVTVVFGVFGGGVIHVKADGPGGNGSSWGSAIRDLQTALALATSGDEIWVAAGEYRPTTGSDRSISFELKPRLPLYGGFAGTETLREQRKWKTHETILSGDLKARLDSSDNSYHVVLGADRAILDGFTVAWGNNASDCGGGLYLEGVPMTVANCVFSGNRAEEGGGIYLFCSDSKISDCVFSGNGAVDGGGGAISAWSSEFTIEGCAFIGNGAAMGGAICNVITSEDRKLSPTLRNCLFVKNNAPYGSAVENSIQSIKGSQFFIWNCTFSKQSGYATLVQDSGSSVVKNCIFWGNTNTKYGDIWQRAAGGSVNTSYCSFGQDPQFVDYAGDDYHLKSRGGHWTASGWVNDAVDSPCLDAGDPADACGDEPSYAGGRINMGAYGNTAEASKTYLAGSNLPPTANALVTPVLGKAPLSVTFDGRASTDSDGTVVSHAWEFGDGSMAVGTQADHVYTQAGTYTATLTITDNGGITDTANAIVMVAPSNRPPQAANDAAYTEPDRPVIIEPLANDTDPDGDDVRVSAVGAAAYGTTAMRTDGTIAYMPAAGFSGTDAFAYAASDGALTATATVTIKVGGIDPTLAGHWKLDDAGGAVATDSSPNAKHGSVIGPPGWIAGKLGGALEFDGINDCVRVPHSASQYPESRATLAGWIRLTAYRRYGQTTYVHLFGNAYDQCINQYSCALCINDWDGTLVGQVYTKERTYTDSKIVIPLDVWTHVAMTYDGKEVSFYVNGRLAEQVRLRYGGMIIASTSPFMIGGDAEATRGYPMLGAMDDIRIYKRVLSGDEISALAGVAARDTDGDGIPDAADPDSDGDGMPNVWETLNLLNPLYAPDAGFDPDGDGMINPSEYIAGTDPWDAGSVFEVSDIRYQAGDFCLGFLTETGRVYGVNGKGDLTETSQWVEVTNGIPGTGGYVEVRDSATGAKKFYRIMVRMQ